MSALSDYAENLLNTWLMTGDSATRPTAWYVALFTAAPSDSGGGTEVSGFNYAREAATFSVTGDTATNTGSLVFEASGGSWGTITHIGIFDAASSGNLLWHGALSASKAVGDGDALAFSIGNISVTLS